MEKENVSLEKRKKKWKEKFYSIKNPEVIRCENKKYKSLVLHDFEFDKDLINKKRGQFAKSEEEWRQRFLWIFNNSPHDHAISLRKSFVLYWIEKSNYLQIGYTHEARIVRQKSVIYIGNFSM